MALPKVMALGTRPISAEKVISNLPTEESIKQLTLELTPDLQWCQFPFKTTKRDIVVDPSFEEFEGLCADWKAMLATTQGQTLLARYGTIMGRKALELKVQLEEVASV